MREVWLMYSTSLITTLSASLHWIRGGNLLRYGYLIVPWMSRVLSLWNEKCRLDFGGRQDRGVLHGKRWRVIWVFQIVINGSAYCNSSQSLTSCFTEISQWSEHICIIQLYDRHYNFIHQDRMLWYINNGCSKNGSSVLSSPTLATLAY